MLKKIETNTIDQNLFQALPTSDSVKEEIVQGKICSVCTSTRFGIFRLRRAQKCEVCHMAICFKCCTRVGTSENVVELLDNFIFLADADTRGTVQCHTC